MRGIGILEVASAMASLSSLFMAPARGGVRRVTGDSKRGRQMQSIAEPRNRSKYVPHIGKKEQERAKRCRMVIHFRQDGIHLVVPRSSPIMIQVSKKLPF